MPTSSSSTPAASASAPKKSSSHASARSGSRASNSAAGRSSPSPAASRSRKATPSSNARPRSTCHRHAEHQAAADAGRARGGTPRPRGRRHRAVRQRCARGHRAARPLDNVSFPLGIARRADPTKAYVTIIEGCNEFCAFCVVPYTRGHERMRPWTAIVAEARQVVAQGAREIQLLGQIVNHYQAPDDAACDFAALLERLQDIDGLERIRFASPHPRHVTPRMIEAMRTLPKVCRHLHLPVQSIPSRWGKSERNISAHRACLSTSAAAGFARRGTPPARGTGHARHPPPRARLTDLRPQRDKVALRLCPQRRTLGRRAETKSRRDDNDPRSALLRPFGRHAVADLDAFGTTAPGAHDRAAQAGAPSDVTSLHEEAVLDLGAALDDHAAPEDRSRDDPPRTTAPSATRQLSVCPGRPTSSSPPRGSERARRGGQRPGGIEEIESGPRAAEVHLRGVVRLDRRRLVPVGAVRAADARQAAVGRRRGRSPAVSRRDASGCSRRRGAHRV